jgi:hypothetical protein
VSRRYDVLNEARMVELLAMLQQRLRKREPMLPLRLRAEL